jgi:signal transduction histidine kinase
VRVKLVETGEPSEDVELQIKIIDEGVGIPKADLPNIFSPFFKSSDPSAPNMS